VREHAYVAMSPSNNGPAWYDTKRPWPFSTVHEGAGAGKSKYSYFTSS